MPTTNQIEKSFIWPDIVYTAVAGAVAGDVAVADIRTVDRLLAVLDTVAGADLTAEFTITADGTINNAAGTSSAGNALLVIYLNTPESIEP